MIITRVFFIPKWLTFRQLQIGSSLKPYNKDPPSVITNRKIKIRKNDMAFGRKCVKLPVSRSFPVQVSSVRFFFSKKTHFSGGIFIKLFDKKFSCPDSWTTRPKTGNLPLNVITKIRNFQVLAEKPLKMNV